MITNFPSLNRGTPPFFIKFPARYITAIFGRMHVSGISYFVISCFFTTLISCNSSASPDPGKISQDSSMIVKQPDLTGITPEEAAWLKKKCENWYDSILKPRNFNGGMLVAKKGNIIFEKYNGTGHIPGLDTITGKTSMHIASISKTFTAMAVLKLAEEGLLNLDDDYSKYFVEFNYPGVTIRSLLNHRSGLPNYIYFLDNMDWDKRKFVTNAEVLDFLISRKEEIPDISSPNSHFSYCNTNYVLLALLIENITGKKYAAYLADTFFTPLHMNNSSVFTLSDTANTLPSYNWNGKIESFNFLDQVYGDKNIYTTPRDLLAWDNALSGNQLFKPGTLEEAYAAYSNEKPGIRNYGLGWRMNIFPTGEKIIYHNGWWHGSNATFIRLINDSATIIIIGNKFTKAVYQASSLISIFGNYESTVDDEEPVQ